jgi:hypothetical protein
VNLIAFAFLLSTFVLVSNSALRFRNKPEHGRKQDIVAAERLIRAGTHRHGISKSLYLRA